MSKKKVKIKRKSSIPKYENGNKTPGTQIDPNTGLPTQPEIPFAMLGQLAGTGVNMVGEQDPLEKGYIGTKVGSGALKGAGMGAQIGMNPALMAATGGLSAPIGAAAGALIGGGANALMAKKERENAQEEAQQNYFANQQEIYQNRPDFFNKGGMITPNTIEVEGKKEGELEVSKGKVLKNFKGQPTHENGGYQYNAKPGRIIIRGKDAKKYLNSDQFTRNSMEREHILSQRNNEQLTEEYKRGGKINFKSKEAYKSWLAYGHASGAFSSTPGNQKVSIRGKKHNVKHADGGFTIPKYGDKNTKPGAGYIKSPAMDYYQNQLNPTNTGNRDISWMQEANLNQEPSDTNLFTQKLPNYTQPNNFNLDLAFGNPLGTTASQNIQLPPNTLNPRNPQNNSVSDPATPNWQQMGVNAATWAPVVYNAAMAFQKPVKEVPIYNPHETEALNTLRNRRINMDPIRRDIYAQERIGATPMGESQGSYLSRRTQLSANTQKALADAQMKAQDINNQYARDYAGGLDTFGQQRVGALGRARQQDLNVAYNQAQYLPKAFEQASYLAQGISQDNRYVPMYAENLKNKYLMSLMESGMDYKTAKTETEKKYPVNEGKSSYAWMKR